MLTMVNAHIPKIKLRREELWYAYYADVILSLLCDAILVQLRCELFASQ
jgi:hypothetical protein